MAGDLNTRKVSYKWINVTLLPLLAIKMKYLYLTPSSTSQITILLDESLIVELTGWLTVNNEEIVYRKHERKNQRQVSLLFKELYLQQDYKLILFHYSQCLKSDPSGYGLFCTIRSHGTKLHTLVRKLRSETSKTMQLVPVHLDLPLFWKAHASICNFVPCDRIVQRAHCRTLSESEAQILILPLLMIENSQSSG